MRQQKICIVISTDSQQDLIKYFHQNMFHKFSKLIFAVLILGLIQSCVYLDDYRNNGPLKGEFGDDIRRLDAIEAKQNAAWFRRRGTSEQDLLGKNSAEVRKILGKPKSSYMPAQSTYCLNHPGVCRDEEGIEKWRYVVPHLFYLSGFHSITIVFLDDRVISISNKP